MLHNSRAIGTLQALDSLGRDIAVIDSQVGIDSRATERDRGDITQNTTIIYRNIGNTATDINHSNTLLHLLLIDHGTCYDSGTCIEVADLDLSIEEHSSEAILSHLLAEDKVIGRRELLAITTHRVGHLSTIIPLV